MSNGRRVLVTNAGQRKSLAAIRSLGRHGIKVTAAEHSRSAMSFLSRYADRAVVYPDPASAPDAFLDWLVSFLDKEHCDVLFPMDDDVLDIITQHLPTLSRYTTIPVVAGETYELARDKLKTIQAAEEEGILCPKTYAATSLEDIKRMQPALTYPLIIKPRKSSGSRGLVYVSNPQELVRSWSVVNSQFPQPLIQEYIPSGGQAFGVSTLLDRESQPLAVFVYRRIREYPLSGGPSACCESIHDAGLADLAIRLLKRLKWFGVAMVEFKTDPRDGLPRLMEINPRFWGSLQLAIYCGLDFPWMLYQVAIGKEFDPIPDYPAARTYRWLPGDILHFLTNSKRWRIARDFFRIDRSRTCYDVFSIEDWRPAFGLIMTLGKQALEAIR